MAAQEQPDAVIRVNVNLIQIDVTAADRSGKRISDLTAADFEVFRAGKRQKVKDAVWVAERSTPAGPPAANPKAIKPHEVRRTIALLLDDLSLSMDSLHYARKALREFVESRMQTGDLVALYRSSSGISVLQQLITDKPQLLRQIDSASLLNRMAANALAPLDPQPLLASPDSSLARQAIEQDMRDQVLNRERQDMLTASSLASATTIVDGLREIPGRKSLILFSEGLQLVDSPFAQTNPMTAGMTMPGSLGGIRPRSLNAIRRLADHAIRAGVVIYTIDPRGLVDTNFTALDRPSSNPRVMEGQLQQRNLYVNQSQDGLITLAEQTGGIAYRNTNDLSQALLDAIEDQQGYYLLSFEPDDETFVKVRDSAKFHNLSVKVKRAGVKLRYRHGMYGVSDEELRRGTDPLTSAMISPFRSTDIPLKLTPLFLRDAKARPMVRALVHFDLSRLQFADLPATPDDTNREPWKDAKVDQLLYLFDSNGKVVSNAGRTHSLRLRGANFQQALTYGLTQELEMTLPGPGLYQLRTAVRDSATGLMGSALQFLDIPNLQSKSLILSDIALNGGAWARNEDIMAGPAVRSIRAGDAVNYGAIIYNAGIAPDTRSPRLEMQVTLLRDGKLIHTGKKLPLAPANHKPEAPLSVSGTLTLGPRTPPGEYLLQLAVSDLANPRKPRYALRSTDFVIR